VSNVFDWNSGVVNDSNTERGMVTQVSVNQNSTGVFLPQNASSENMSTPRDVCVGAMLPELREVLLRLPNITVACSYPGIREYEG